MSNNASQLIPLTSYGDIRAVELSPIFQLLFDYTVTNTELVTNTTANTGTATQSDSMAVVGTGTTTASTALLESKRHAVYRAGLGALGRFTTIFSTPVAGTFQVIGFFDETGSTALFKNGLGIGYNGTIFSLFRFDNDVMTTVALSAWDNPLDGSIDDTLVAANLNTWGINYQSGAGNIEVLRENDDSGLIDQVHQLKYHNLNTSPSNAIQHYKFMMYVDNQATTSNVTMKSSEAAFLIEGKSEFIEIHQPQFSSHEQEKTTVTTETAIFTIRNKSTYTSKTNFIDLFLENFSCSIEASSANNLGQVRLVRNATLGGTPSYSDIDTTDSVAEIDTAGTTVTGGKELIFSPLAGKNDREFVNLFDYKIILAPGETITVAGSSANSATIRGGVLWKELF